MPASPRPSLYRMDTYWASKSLSGDNGRVLGYDNSHGYSHRHYLGSITPEPFDGYEKLYDRFEQEWQTIAVRFVNGEQI